MEVTVADVVSIRALGKNKKEAEQEAARRALDLLALQEGGSVP
jgi:dsRNA-specific ribonuclease